MQIQKINKIAAVLAILVLIVVILVYGKPFLVPVAFAGLLSMLLLPVAKWLKSKGVNEVISIVLSILLFLSFFALVIFFMSWQISDIASNASKLEEQITKKYQEVQQVIAQEWGISKKEQEQLMQKQQSSSSGKMTSIIAGFVKGLGGFLANTILVLVYIFLFIYFRNRIKGFIIRLVNQENKDNALEIITKSQKVAQKYLGGLSIMIVILWISYGIGFSIAGVKNALFFAVLCGLLEIVPFVGNLTGTALTLGMAMVEGGGSGVIIGVLITYAIIQFVQTYIIEPLVVGSEVNINPMFTIIGLIAGELLWGIPGMVVAIPLLGVIKIICDHIEPLKPYGYLIGEKEKEDSGFKKKLKQLGEKVTEWFK